VTKPGLNKPKRPSSKQKGDSVVACLSTSRARRTAEQAQLAEESQSQNTELVDLQSLKDAIDQLPEINASRVIDLHNRIKAKEYEIDVAGLAEKLMAFEERLDR
jgi:anti-sigma28 factor (negative regulator of flagellin synthesis)